MTDSHYDGTGAHAAGGAAVDDGVAEPVPVLPKRLWMVFFQPGDLFRGLAARPVWFVTALLGAFMVALSIVLLPTDLFVDAALSQMSPEAAAAARDVPAWLFKAQGVIAGPFMLAMLFVVSAVTYVIFVVIRGDRTTYRHHLSVMAHGVLIGAVGALATTPLKIASGNVQETLSLADLVGFLPIPDGFLLALLNAMELFGIWGALIAGFGLSIVGNRPKWGGTAAVMLVLVVVFASIAAALQTAFGG
ncbi:MAG: YIP1 family protein [Gemmatimonadetes bacterium]|nr:YIP1 family protein [Gemmatimonadota bacterium]